MHLQPNRAFTAPAPSSNRLLLTEIINAEPFSSIAPKTQLIFGAFRAKIQVVGGVLEQAQRCCEVVESTRLPRRNWRCSNELESMFGGYPENHRRLRKLVPVNYYYILSAVDSLIRKHIHYQIALTELFRVGHIQPSIHFLGK